MFIIYVRIEYIYLVWDILYSFTYMFMGLDKIYKQQSIY